MLSEQYWWLSLLVFLLFVGINVVVVLLRNKPYLAYRIAYYIAFFLLIYKAFYYTIFVHFIRIDHWDIPVELSALSYILFGLFIVFRIRKAEMFPIFVAILSGMMYSITIWVSPDSFVGSIDTLYRFVMAIINHHLLYFGGMLMLINVSDFKSKRLWQMPLFLGICIGYSWLIYLNTPYGEIFGKPIIIRITDTTIFDWVLGHPISSVGGKIAYYVIFSIFVLILMLVFYVINQKNVWRRKSNELPPTPTMAFGELIGYVKFTPPAPKEPID